MTATQDSLPLAVAQPLPLDSKMEEAGGVMSNLTAAVVPEETSTTTGPASVPRLSSAFSSLKEHHVLEWNVAEISIKLAGKRFNFLRSQEKKQPPRIKTIVRNVACRTESGEFTAIMGPSGAGKTTLVECLSMRNRNFEGAIHLDGKPPGGEYFTTSALVHQRELLFGFLTAREHLYFHAKTRLGNAYTEEQIKARIDAILADMNLEKAANTQIGGTEAIFFKKGLSGGERKRLCVGTELLMSPSILFLDEPTSGLDSLMAESVVQTLRQVADRGAIVICSVHSPTSVMVKIFTHLVLLTYDGRLAFHGRFTEATAHFSRLNFSVPKVYNPSEFFLKTVSPLPSLTPEENTKKMEYLVEGFKKSGLAMVEPPPVSNSHKYVHSVRGLKISTWELIKLNVWRGTLQVFRDLICLFSWGGVFTLIGLIYGGLFYEQAGESWRAMLGMSFSVVVAVALTASVAAMMRFPLEWSVVVREYFAGANAIGPYVFSKYIYDFPNSYAPVLLSTLLYWMTGLEPTFVAYLKWAGTMVLINQCSVAVAYFIASFSANPGVGLSIFPVVVAPMILFSGLLYQRSSVPHYLSWIQHVSLVNYGFSALLGLQLHILPPSGQEIIIKFVEIDPSKVRFDVIMLVVMMVVFYFLVYFNLRMRLRGSRDG